jgi:hypothetical protein
MRFFPSKMKKAAVVNEGLDPRSSARINMNEANKWRPFAGCPFWITSLDKQRSNKKCFDEQEMDKLIK